MIIDWKKIALEKYNEVKNHIYENKLNINLKVILVWNNPDSIRYIRQKEKWASFCNIWFELIHLEEETTQGKLVEIIEKLNNDSETTWYLVQSPLPRHIDIDEVIEKISPLKDVDGFHQENYWKLAIWKNSMKACTPFWIMELLDAYDIDPEWKNVTIIWRSNIVWKPLALMMINRGATVTVCNSKTKNLNYFTKTCDILISATWRPQMIKKDMIWEDSIVIDVWFTVLDGKIYGDCDFESITKNWNMITPVPWWVWPMTVAMIMKNLIRAYEIQN